tara:strand:+ start:2202 stop:2555 length:354 start_codon:yes stop_codon:yes gene_type:complete
MNLNAHILSKIYPNVGVTTRDGKIIKWKSTEIPQPTEEEIQSKLAELQAEEPMRLLKEERNQKLTETDWRDLPSYPGTDQTAWRTYRQALRDLPSVAEPQLDEEGNLTNVTWPTKPE